MRMMGSGGKHDSQVYSVLTILKDYMSLSRDESSSLFFLHLFPSVSHFRSDRRPLRLLLFLSSPHSGIRLERKRRNYLKVLHNFSIHPNQLHPILSLLHPSISHFSFAIVVVLLLLMYVCVLSALDSSQKRNHILERKRRMFKTSGGDAV